MSGKDPGDDPKVLALLAKGFDEVTPDELNYVMEAGKCTREQLEERFSLEVVRDKLQKKDRFFFHKDDVVMTYVGVFRSGDQIERKIPFKSSLLGLGGGTLCP